MAAMLGNSAVAVVVRTRPRAIPLAMITMRKSSHEFPFLSYTSMGLRLAPFGPPELPNKYLTFSDVLGRGVQTIKAGGI